MLSTEEIKRFIEEDATSEKKLFAKKGQAYYDGDHDIRFCRLFYFNADGELVEDKTRSNIKIPHPFFTELVDQGTQYILSGEGAFIKSDIPELQTELDRYFNEDEDFIAELSEVLTGCQAKGFENMYAYKNAENRTAFQCADSIGVVEVRAKDAEDKKEHVIYWYIDRIEKGQKKIKRIQEWDETQVYFYVQDSEGKIELDESEPINPKPHTLYTKNGKEGKTYFGEFGFIPFFRLDNNKKQFSGLKPIKDLIDDYDVHASSLTNNLIDFDTPLHVVKGFQGDDLTELQQNLKTKKIIGVDDGGGVEVHTVDIPYQARQAKLELDEKNIYRFGMGLNTAGLKDTNATTNVAIKAAYSLLDLRCSKLEIRLKQFLRKLIKVVLQEVNDANGTDYQMKDVYFNFEHEIMSNAKENVDVELVEAQRKQTEITTLQNIASLLDNETLMQLICEQLDIDYDDIKDKLPDPDEAANAVKDAQDVLDSVVVEDEQTAEGSSASIPE
ncbi:MAG: phage portal protein [Roseburia sp.]|nr:phage portal protein [Roseburia sp.]MBQ8279559.1 phage portal protein [Roseburia sp.]